MAFYSAFQLTNEANAISQALNRNFVFNIELQPRLEKDTPGGASQGKDIGHFFPPFISFIAPDPLFSKSYQGHLSGLSCL